MNNEQFRRLLVNPNPSDAAPTTSTQSHARPAALGSRKAAFASMAPRSTKTATNLFARPSSTPGAKSSKTRPVKGTKLAPGYEDRTLARLNDPDTEEARDEKAERIAALEKQVKEGTLSRAEFERLREQITGGDVGSTHLVKGLDRALLARVRKGEDVMSAATKVAADATVTQPEAGDVDHELDALESATVAPVEHQKGVKKGELSTVKPAVPKVAGVKRSRNDILAELKAQRQADAAARAALRPALGENFKAVTEGSGPAAPKTIIDHKGREVILVRDENGKIKKKVRKVVLEPPTVQVSESEKVDEPEPMDPAAEPMQEELAEPVVVAQGQQEEDDDDDDDDDIFEDAGRDYDPLGQQDDSEDEPERPAREEDKANHSEDDPTTIKHSYFGSTAKEQEGLNQAQSSSLSDATVIAAIKRASDMAKAKGDIDVNDSSTLRDADEQARLKKRAAMLSAADRDLEDMDMGFGSSRFDDAADGDADDGDGHKLQEWKGLGANDHGDGPAERAKGPKKRTRKRKGDKDSYADVMSVLERRK